MGQENLRFKDDLDKFIVRTIKIRRSHDEMIDLIAYTERIPKQDVYNQLIEFGLKNLKKNYSSTQKTEKKLFD